MGPRLEPWGTPYFKGKDEEFMSPTETDCVVGKVGCEPFEDSATDTK